MNRPIALTLGEPAGIGPDIVIQLWKTHPDLFSRQDITLVGDATLLQNRADLLNISCDVQKHFSILPVSLRAPVTPGKLDTRNAQYVIDTLSIATIGCLEKKFSSMVTGPVHKGIINEANIKFLGHTDFLTKLTHTSQTVMMLMTSELKVALLTGHVPLNQVTKLITKKHLKTAIKIIVHDFQTRFHIAHPRIIICGINPHAGENGYLGTEEKNIVIPVIRALFQDHFSLIGPVSADVAFTESYRKQGDVILAMYHDQGLPVIKYTGFHHAINVTLGLPFIRTSVDHGTALDIAGTGHADCCSLYQAIQFAREHE